MLIRKQIFESNSSRAIVAGTPAPHFAVAPFHQHLPTPCLIYLGKSYTIMGAGNARILGTIYQMDTVGSARRLLAAE